MLGAAEFAQARGDQRARNQQQTHPATAKDNATKNDKEMDEVVAASGLGPAEKARVHGLGIGLFQALSSDWVGCMLRQMSYRVFHNLHLGVDVRCSFALRTGPHSHVSLLSPTHDSQLGKPWWYFALLPWPG